MRPQPDTRDDVLWRPGARRTILTRECDHHQALRACSSRKAVIAPVDRRMLSTTATAVLASVDDNSAELIVVWPGRFHHACLRPKSTAVPAVHLASGLRPGRPAAGYLRPGRRGAGQWVAGAGAQPV